MDSIEEVIGKVDNRINQYWWKNLSIIFRSDFTESADGHVEFKRFNAEMQPWEKDNAPPEPFPCWKILDIESDASNASAKKARDKLLKQYHPDKVPLHISAEFKDLANRRTLEINKAYEDFTSR